MSWWTNFRDGFTKSSGIAGTTSSGLGGRAGASIARQVNRKPAATPALIDAAQTASASSFGGLPSHIAGIPTRTALIGVALALAYKFFR